MSVSLRKTGFFLDDDTPALAWEPAGRLRRLGAWGLDLVLFVVTLGVGWIAWAWRAAARSTSPGKGLLGLTVFAADTRRPATRSRMLLRGAVYTPAAVLIGVSTLGLGWVYMVVGTAGQNRRTIYDEWAQVVVLAPPRAS